MKNKKREAKTKALVVIEGLKGKPVKDICLEYQISQAQYYQWRDKRFASLPQLFNSTSRKEAAREREIARLEEIIGELTVELKEASWSHKIETSGIRRRKGP